MSDEAITRKLLALPEYKSAKTVFLYYSVGREVSTLGIMHDAVNSGKRLGLPVCSGAGEMHFAEVSDVSRLRPGRFGIPEPEDDAPELVPDEETIMILPCLCADSDRNRLGHGAGYYDRYLSKNRCLTVCLCRKELIEDKIPAEKTDIKPDIVLSE